MKFKILQLCLICAFILAQNSAFAQNFPGSGGGGFGNVGQSRGGGGSTGLVVRDTTDIHYFFAENPSEAIPFSDSLLGNFQQYDPLRQGALDHANLGYLGSAHRPLFFQPLQYRRGFDVGLNQFDLYQMRTADVRYYRIVQATTQAGYSQGPTQDDGYTFIRFSRNFADGLNLSVETRRIKNLGAYDFQETINSDVSFGLWYHNKFGNYDGFLSFVSNSVTAQDNGGIQSGSDSIFTDAFRMDVNLVASNTRHSNREYSYTQYFYLNKIFGSASVDRRGKRKIKRQKAKDKKREERRLSKLEQDSVGLDSILVLSDSIIIDSVQADSVIEGSNAPSSTYPTPPGQSTAPSPESFIPTNRTFTLYHQITWRKEDYKFWAEPIDSLGFGNFWVDDRGLRHFVEARKVENTIKLQTFKLRPEGTNGTAKQRDLLEVGLIHSAHFIDQEPRDTGTLHNLFLTGKFNFSPSDRLRVNTYAHLGLAANAGDFKLSGELFFDLNKIGNLRIEAINQLYSPTLVQHQFFAMEQQIWKNDFSKTLETSLIGTYALPSANASVSGQYHLTNNLIYFDTAGLPQQKGSVTNVFQLIFRKDFHLGALHSENWLGLQTSTSDVLRLPSFYSKHSLYLEGKIFKKVMLSRIGVDARLATAYTPPSYQPLTGQFFLQSEQSLPFTPLVDAFLSFKVKTFRFFFKVENTLSFFTKEFYFQTAGYPQPFGFGNGGLRFGVNWRLVD